MHKKTHTHTHRNNINKTIAASVGVTTTTTIPARRNQMERGGGEISDSKSVEKVFEKTDPAGGFWCRMSKGALKTQEPRR